MKKFALMGVAGYIAPRHLAAIRDTANELVAAFDKFDSVGILDSYFSNAVFFRDFELFDRQIERYRRNGSKVDFMSICTPTYLHDSHVRFALRSHAHVVCERPLVLDPRNIDMLAETELETGYRVFNILQLRLHPSIVALKARIEEMGPDLVHDVDLTYITPRGSWYYNSWKGDPRLSGGLAANIGIHFLDILIWVFGPLQEHIVHVSEPNKAGGLIYLEKARVRWFLSLDYKDIPESFKIQNKRNYRALSVNSAELDFGEGFGELHTRSYEQVLNGNGFGLAEVRPCVELCHDIRYATPVGLKGEYHPFLENLML